MEMSFTSWIGRIISPTFRCVVPVLNAVASLSTTKTSLSAAKTSLSSAKTLSLSGDACTILLRFPGFIQPCTIRVGHPLSRDNKDSDGEDTDNDRKVHHFEFLL
uniref:Uncharacterized protein n=1 Tax=Cacopsylla melanoneura TaxID=428564 RepID=A0A8D8USP7_9HEMI